MKPSRNPARRCVGRGENAATAGVVRPPAERNRDVALCSMGPEPGKAGAAAWSAACDRADADAAALIPDCCPLGTGCLKDLAGALSAVTGTVALAIEVGTGGLGTPVSLALTGVSVVSGTYGAYGTCATDDAASCGLSIAATGLPVVGLGGRFLGAAGLFGENAVVARGAEVAWSLTWQFVAVPFGFTGPLLWLNQVIAPERTAP